MDQSIVLEVKIKTWRCANAKKSIVDGKCLAWLKYSFTNGTFFACIADVS